MQKAVLPRPRSAQCGRRGKKQIPEAMPELAAKSRKKPQEAQKVKKSAICLCLLRIFAAVADFCNRLSYPVFRSPTDRFMNNQRFPMTMKKTLASLLAASTLAAPGYSQGALYTINQSGGVQGTALNSTSVIGAGSDGATAVNLANGSQLILGTPGNTVDAGQYNNTVNMYLDNSGILNFVDNMGNPYNFIPGHNDVLLGGATAVSSAVNVNGTQYAMLAGPSIGLRALNLTDGSLTPVSGPWNFTGMTGLDAVMRPNGRTLNDLAIGVVYNYGGDPLLKLYGSNGSLLDSAAPDSGLGIVNDMSLDLANNKIWYGTKLSSGEGCLFSDTYDFSRVAVIPPKLQFSRTGNNRYTFSYIGTPNFALQVATDIASPGWTTLTNQFTAVGTVCSTVLTNIASPGYYRLIR